MPRNLILLTLSIIVAIFLFNNQGFHDFLHSSRDYGYIGAFLAGTFFVSTFTAAIGTVVLLFLAEDLNIALLIFLGTCGCVCGDLLILKFIRSDGLNDEVKNLFGKKRIKRIKILFRSPYFSWMLPVIGALLIAAPGPDELGVSLLGISEMSTRNFILISFGLNLISMITIVGVAKLIG
jgi:uncharacterized membrane protein YdjX (TVP38/TMEM64 family)